MCGGPPCKDFLPNIFPTGRTANRRPLRNGLAKSCEKKDIGISLDLVTVAKTSSKPRIGLPAALSGHRSSKRGFRAKVWLKCENADRPRVQAAGRDESAASAV
jgi:hypothetical protein